MFGSRSALAAACLAAATVIAGSATPALAAASAVSWSPHWTLTRVSQPPQIQLSPVTVHLAARLRAQPEQPVVRVVDARVTSPAGKVSVLALARTSGTRASGTWRKKLSLPPQSPAGRWRVVYVAHSTAGQTAFDPVKAHFSVTKHVYPPVAVWQHSSHVGRVIIRPGAPPVTVQAFWDKGATDADVTLTGPRGYHHRVFAYMTRIAGDKAYGLFQAVTALPRSAAPGTWKVSVEIGDNGTWGPGPTGTFQVKQSPTVVLRVSTTRDPNVGGKIVFTGRVGAFGAGGKWRAMAHVLVCLWWKTTQPGDQWACDHRFHANGRGRFTDPEFPLHGAWYKAVVKVRGMVAGSSRVVFVRVVGGASA